MVMSIGSKGCYYPAVLLAAVASLAAGQGVEITAFEEVAGEEGHWSVAVSPERSSRIPFRLFLLYDLYLAYDLHNLGFSLDGEPDYEDAVDVYLLLHTIDGQFYSIDPQIRLSAAGEYIPYMTGILPEKIDQTNIFQYRITGTEGIQHFVWEVILTEAGMPPMIDQSILGDQVIEFDVFAPTDPKQWVTANELMTSLVRCSETNLYPDAQNALGIPDADGIQSEDGTYEFSGFVSLGLNGRIVVKLAKDIIDLPGNDLRIWQSVADERIKVRVAVAPEGPFYTLREDACGKQASIYSNYCDFDLADGKLTRARYIKIVDRQMKTNPDATCYETAGADIDAVQALHFDPDS